MAFCYLSAGIFREDRKPISKRDLNDFTALWMKFYDPKGWYGSKPSFTPNQTMIWADYSCSGVFEVEAFAAFAESHPHLQMEVIERFEDYDENEIRHLYQGDLYEELRELRFFEKPKRIFWRNDWVEQDPRLADKEFLREFGEMILLALEDMKDNTTCEELGEYVVRSLRYYQEPAEDMFSAVVGWDAEELINRTKENIRLRKEENHGF